MKKVLALMLAMALVLGAALSGCGSSGEEVTSTTAAAAEENTQNTQTADNLTGMEAFSMAILESRINIICRSQKLSDKKLALRCICPWFPPVFHSRWVFCSV